MKNPYDSGISPALWEMRKQAAIESTGVIKVSIEALNCVETDILNYAALHENKELAATDSQQLKQAIALLKRWRTIYGSLNPDPGVYIDTDKFLAQRTCV